VLRAGGVHEACIDDAQPCLSKVPGDKACGDGVGRAVGSMRYCDEAVAGPGEHLAHGVQLRLEPVEHTEEALEGPAPFIGANIDVCVLTGPCEHGTHGIDVVVGHGRLRPS
jgi:hypothetical protein